MTNVSGHDLSEAMARAIRLTAELGYPTVLVGALAMAAYGYQRETSDVDIVIPIAVKDGPNVVIAGSAAGLAVRTRHSFGGWELRSGDGKIRIDVLTLEQSVPSLVPDAIFDAVTNQRIATVYGHEVLIVSLGHLIAMKMIAERKKDIADIIELVKVRIVEAPSWPAEQSQIAHVVSSHLGWYAARHVGELIIEAQDELRR